MKYISEWKKYFDNKEKLFIFVSYILLLPSPAFLGIGIGLIPPIIFAVFPINIILDMIFFGTDNADPLSAIPIFGISFIHFVISLYINRFPVFLTRKALNFIKDQTIRWFVIILLILTLLISSFTLYIYWFGDIGGGEHHYNILMKSKEVEEMDKRYEEQLEDIRKY